MTLKMGDVLNVKAKDFPLADQAHWKEWMRKTGERIKAIESANGSAARSEFVFKEVK